MASWLTKDIVTCRRVVQSPHFSYRCQRTAAVSLFPRALSRMPTPPIPPAPTFRSAPSIAPPPSFSSAPTVEGRCIHTVSGYVKAVYSQGVQTSLDRLKNPNIDLGRSDRTKSDGDPQALVIPENAHDRSTDHRTASDLDKVK